ncbi:MAG: hypothetical protein ACTSXD_00490, partial [Candidatus Heimdallarchaeaceae archaeon]
RKWNKIARDIVDTCETIAFGHRGTLQACLLGAKEGLDATMELPSTQKVPFDELSRDITEVKKIINRYK